MVIYQPLLPQISLSIDLRISQLLLAMAKDMILNKINFQLKYICYMKYICAIICWFSKKKKNINMNVLD